mgnify:CR=1 FL=1
MYEALFQRIKSTVFPLTLNEAFFSEITILIAFSLKATSITDLALISAKVAVFPSLIYVISLFLLFSSLLSIKFCGAKVNKIFNITLFINIYAIKSYKHLVLVYHSRY